MSAPASSAICAILHLRIIRLNRTRSASPGEEMIATLDSDSDLFHQRMNVHHRSRVRIPAEVIAPSLFKEERGTQLCQSAIGWLTGLAIGYISDRLVSAKFVVSVERSRERSDFPPGSASLRKVLLSQGALGYLAMHVLPVDLSDLLQKSLKLYRICGSVSCFVAC